ncbi:hypothetical protein A2392_03045 [Candidatus Kaiserbacteria bacterium RIFOXYB1_FULL_46_14]|uniref:DedA family protein n=1 Tax=Candidatus Kaiserbacteria bacterium RIFOXYB1_FULL_46_14 TaxID=1798531 RepID=A0A1F6FIS8_9BACT|nr:MAG: hypothetical protein A2392_03045 [Candidatus Kaiserbacteria bacterium RIFOXYB1_FULL_46_14]
MSWYKRHYRLLALIAIFAVTNVFLLLIGPEQLVSSIGVENTYLVVFVIAAVGGMSSFTGAAYVNAIIAFTAGGANPWLIGLCGGLGAFISDSVFYIIAEYSRQIVPVEWRPLFRKITKKMQVLPTRSVLAFTYIYHMLPLPSDIMMLALVLGGYGYRTVAPVIFLAALTCSTLIAHFGSLWFWFW